MSISTIYFILSEQCVLVFCEKTRLSEINIINQAHFLSFSGSEECKIILIVLIEKGNF